jgi:parallel beta-helix repeat protein
MHKELALVFSVAMVIISMQIWVGVAGFYPAPISHDSGNSLMDINDDGHGSHFTPFSNNLLLQANPENTEMIRGLPSRFIREQIFNASDMERRFLAIHVPLEIPKPEQALAPHVPGEVIVKLREGAGFAGSSVAVEAAGKVKDDDVRSLKELNEQFGVRLVSKVFRQNEKPDARPGLLAMGGGKAGAVPDLTRIYKLRLDEDADIGAVIDEYMRNPLVEYAEPNYIYKVFATPSDTQFSSQWAHTKLDSETGWDIETGNESTIIAIIDTGVDWNHPDLADNIWNNTDEVSDGNDTDGNGYVDDVRGYDFVDTTSSCYSGEDCKVEDNNPMDFHGHGTHCSGIAAAVTNNAVGVAGVCWNCKVMALKAGFKYTTGDGVLEEEDVAQAIEYAANNSADVISMSFGGTHTQLIQDAIDYAYSQGVVLIAASGNENTGSEYSSYPAAYDNVIAVSATTNSDTKSSYSNYGYWIDVSAPGGEPTYQSSSAILSTMFDNAYASWAGTSMACPHVAGLAGLILSKNPGFTQAEVRKVLKSSTDPISTDKYMGFGRINLNKALQIDEVPSSDIYAPSTEDVIEGSAAITGTASGTNFINYTLLYGSGMYPASWTSFADSTSEVFNSSLGTWDTTTVPDGQYILRLLVQSTSGWSEDRVLVRVLNNGTTCVSCDDCTYKINNYQNGPFFFLANNITASEDCIDIERDGVIFNCNNKNISGSGEGFGIRSYSSDNVTIRNCVVENFQQGIYLSISKNSNLTSNKLNNNGQGLWISGSYSRYYNHSIDTSNTVDGRPVNYYYDFSDQVISLANESGHLEVAYSNNVTVTGNDVFGDGIKLDNVTGSLVKDNNVANAKSGVYIGYGSKANIFTGNVITKDYDFKHGFYFDTVSDTYINNVNESNTVNGESVYFYYDVHGSAGDPLVLPPGVLDEPNTTNVGKISLINTSFIKVSGFTTSNNFIGIYVVNSHDIEVSSNTVSNNDMGIMLGLSSDSVISGNTVSDNTLLGIFSESTNTTFTGNSVTNTQNCSISYNFFGYIFTMDFGGIGIADVGSTVNANNITGNGCSGVSVWSDNNIVSGNTISNNKGGIYLAGSDNNISGNAISKPSDYVGFYIYSTSNYINQSNTVEGEPVYYYYNVQGTADNPVVIDSLLLNQPNVTNSGKINLVKCKNFNITNVSVSGNQFGIYLSESENVTLMENVMDGALALAFVDSSLTDTAHNNLTCSQLALFEIAYAPYISGIYLSSPVDVNVWENNVLGDCDRLVYSLSYPFELSYQNSGNFWGRTDPPYFVPGNDSNYENVTDSYAYGKLSGWLDNTSPVLQFIAPTLPDGNYTNDNWIFVNVSADENITGCLLEWENASQNISMTVSRDNENTYCYLNMTDLDYGLYYYTVYANDSAHNWNRTDRRSVRLNGPPSISDAVVTPHILLSDEAVNISATVTDGDNVSAVYYKIINNGTAVQQGQMQAGAGDTYTASPSISSGPEKYNITIFTNDTLGAEIESLIDTIEFKNASSVTIYLRDHQGNAMNISLSVFDPQDNHVRNATINVSNATFSLPSGYWDLNLSRWFWIIMHDTDFTEDVSGQVTVDDVPVDLATPPAHKQFSSVIAAETNLSHDSAHIMIPYSGRISNENRIVAYRCADWNMSGRNCVGGSSGWGNKLSEGDDYSVDRSLDIMTINVTGFSAYAAGEEVPYCGNGIVDDDAEDCDGTDLDGETCDSLGYDYGDLGCTGGCVFDRSDCGSYSGNGVTKILWINNFTSSIDIPQGGSKTVPVQVKNGGNVDLTNVVLYADTDCSGCTAQTSPSSMDIPPGITGNFTLALSVTYTQALGAYSLNLTATCNEQVSSKAQSTIVVSDSGLLCIPRALKCSITGNLLRCNDAGSAWETEELCDHGCENEACKTICTPSGKRCSGDVLQQCMADGSGWDDVEDCDHGCDAQNLRCESLITLPPVEGDKRCFGNETQMYLNGRWMSLDNCSGGCVNGTCVAAFFPPISFDPGQIILVVAVVVISAGAGFYLYNTYMRKMTWDDLEHKWEIIETNSAELLSNAQHFLNKKVRISGTIVQSIQDDRGVMGSTLQDDTGQVLVFSNPPGPKGRVELTGFVGQNEFGETYVEVQSFKTNWLWFLSMVRSLKIMEWLKSVYTMIMGKFQKGGKKT